MNSFITFILTKTFHDAPNPPSGSEVEARGPSAQASIQMGDVGYAPSKPRARDGGSGCTGKRKKVLLGSLTLLALISTLAVVLYFSLSNSANQTGPSLSAS